jgi:hypothetical protein
MDGWMDEWKDEGMDGLTELIIDSMVRDFS